MGIKKLLVEGRNDQIVISTLCKCHDIWVYNEAKIVQPRKGKSFAFECKSKDNDVKLLNLKQLKNEIISGSDVEAVGIVVDADYADNAVEGRWQTLRDRLRDLGYSDIPKVPDENGTVILDADLPKIGVWIMPNNRLEGMLEDFAALLVPPDDKLWKYALDCVDNIAPNDRPFIPNHLPKARIHTWLAWQNPPGVPMGVAISEKYLDANAPQSQEFVDWLRRLFEIEA